MRPNFDVFGQSEQNATFINSSMDITESKRETPMIKKPIIKKKEDEFSQNMERVDSLMTKINKSKKYKK